MTEYNRGLRKNDFEFIRKKRTALFKELNRIDGSQPVRWYWIGRNLQMIQSVINEGFINGYMTSYQYHIAFRWACALEKYVSDRMLEEL